MGLSPIRLGILSTAHINRLVIPGAHASDKVELVVPKLQTVRKLSKALGVQPVEVAEFARAIGLTEDATRAPE